MLKKEKEKMVPHACNPSVRKWEVYETLGLTDQLA